MCCLISRNRDQADAFLTWESFRFRPADRQERQLEPCPFRARAHLKTGLIGNRNSFGRVEISGSEAVCFVPELVIGATSARGTGSSHTSESGTVIDCVSRQIHSVTLVAQAGRRLSLQQKCTSGASAKRALSTRAELKPAQSLTILSHQDHRAPSASAAESRAI